MDSNLVLRITTKLDAAAHKGPSTTPKKSKIDQNSDSSSSSSSSTRLHIAKVTPNKAKKGSSSGSSSSSSYDKEVEGSSKNSDSDSTTDSEDVIIPSIVGADVLPPTIRSKISAATGKCPCRGCNVQLSLVNGVSFLKHIKDIHPDYNPSKTTILKYGCKLCFNCGLVTAQHVCQPKVHVLTATDELLLPSLTEDGSSASQFPCPVPKCTFILPEPLTQNFIDHCKAKHPFYRPIITTLARYGCCKCICCGIVPLDHVCRAKIQSPSNVNSVSYNMPGKSAYMQTVDISWTVTLSDIDITQNVYSKLKTLIDDYFHIGVVCLERGNKNKRLHAQCTGRLYFPGDDKAIRWLGSRFRKELQEVSHVPIKHQLKAYGKNQTVRAMIGYCMKQSNHPFFQMHVKGISESELRAARAEYSTLNADPADGKVIIVRKNLFKMVYGAYKTDYYPTAMSFVEVLTNMLNRDYYLDSTFFLGPGLNLKKCELMWEHISQRRVFKTVDLEKLMFEDKGGNKAGQDFTEDVLYTLNDFQNTEVKAFVISKVASRCNFMLIGDTNIGKTQLVLSSLQSYFRGNTHFLIVRTKEDLKNIKRFHQTVIFDDFNFDDLNLSECIRLLDRDASRKSIECKYEVAVLFRHQQIIVINNKKHPIFVENKMISNRIICFDDVILSDLRKQTERVRLRETSRGNHLLMVPLSVDELLNMDDQDYVESENEENVEAALNNGDDLKITSSNGDIWLRGNQMGSGLSRRLTRDDMSAASDDSRPTNNDYSHLDQTMLNQALRKLDKRIAEDEEFEENYYTHQASRVTDEPNLIRPKRTKLSELAKSVFEDECKEDNSGDDSL